MIYENEKSKALFAQITENPEKFPVSFKLSGKQYFGFPAGDFKKIADEKKETEKKIERNIVLCKDNLKIEWKAAYHKGYGVSEYTVWLENIGETDTEVISEFNCIDLYIKGAKPVAKGILGDHENYYAPYECDLSKESKNFVNVGGRATHIYFPYFNIEHEDGGMLVALGWMGTWQADISAKGDETHLVAAPVVGLNLPLHKGERVRLALTVLAPYFERNEDKAMNYWRDWFINCNMPKEDIKGNNVAPFSACCLASDTGLPNSDGSISERSTTWRPSLEKQYAEGCKVDFRWFDAGWYCDPNGETVPTDWWGTIGTWELDKEKWPGNSFAESVEFSHQNGQRTLMWFEPQRVTNPEALEKNYGYKKEWGLAIPGHPGIANNIGDPDCFRWTTDRVKKVLVNNKVDMYREDFNFDPGNLWKNLDKEDGRTGITEIKVVMAHYNMWDELIEATESVGGCSFCDSCASGGGINDIDTLRRGIPLLRSDADRTSTALRLSMTSSFCKWVPFCGANTKEKIGQLDPTGRSDVYTWRASYLPCLNCDSQFVYDESQNFDILRFGLTEWKEINKYLLKDMYVLTPWHDRFTTNDFTAISYFDRDENKGVLFLFRQEECEKENFTLDLSAIGNIAKLTDKDTGEELEYKKGMTLTLNEKRMAKLYYIG